MTKIGKKKKRIKKALEPESYFIGSEGIKTEVIYFNGWANNLKKAYSGFENRIIVPTLKVQGIGTSNQRLINDIEEYLRNDPRIFENVWVIFDRDDVPKDYFDDAIFSAEKRGWHVGWSNDSFELWYLLHFEYLNSAISRQQYKEKLSKYLRKFGILKYQKNNAAIFSALYPLTKTAIKNANNLEKEYKSSSKKPHEENPCTTVQHLVQRFIDLENKIEHLKQTNR
ncbi:RloB family protein [Ligilactobacillus sp. WILCCON 0076]|uniref:RloB family protein n=1 Tax=Ligilactobacillus ubinensis TaxID=2876789 RepID=A0A9X2JMI5_9LACO|nr:RloB family protein [Ligilactobacillus ubinensis]MCP0887131.1 RloB family protein [Ligilactobacillus ubinensis]